MDSCTSSYQPLMNTWNQKGSLHPSDYDPFASMNWTQENFGCAKYNTNSTSWTRAGNVTPDNSPGYNQASVKFTPAHKEKFSSNCNCTYSRVNQTWNKQKKYTSN